MSITFKCEHCRKQIKAPDESAGRRGKCPFCKQSCYIPAPVSEDEIIPVAPIDEEEERRHKQKVQELLSIEQDILSEGEGEGESGSAVSLEHQEDLKPEDLHHLVVNYCLDMSQSNLNRAEHHAAQLRKFGPYGRQAVNDFVEGQALEPALDAIPPKVLQGFLKELLGKVKL